jgi:hypothetical protein
MKRPTGITVISVLLAWLAVAGIANAVVWNLSVVQELLARLPSSERLPDIGGPFFSLLCLAYGLAAGSASVALWHMHRISAGAYAAWCLTVMLSGAYMVAAGFEPNITVGVLFAVGTTGFVALGYPYISSRIPSVRPNKSLERTRGR